MPHWAEEKKMNKAFVCARTHPLRVAAVLALAVAATLFVPAVHSADSAGRTVQVEITKFTFAPKEITVAPGTRVIWINHDETPHTVAANDKSFGSKGMDTDDKFERVFAQEG